MKILVVDGNSILNRAFFGVRPLTTKDGLHTNAIYGFLATLLRVMTQEQPQSVAVAFDVREPTFRHKLYDGYKAGRKGMPEELRSQLQPVKDILTTLGMHVVTCPGFEADDILGTLSAGAANAGWDCLLCTGDRDSMQLVNEHVRVFLPSTKAGDTTVTIFDEGAVLEKYGLPVSLMIDLKSLMGDSSDMIPGAAGIGEKTAVKLLSEYGSVDGVYENLHQLPKGQREKLEQSREMVALSKQLATIDCNVPVERNPAAYLLGDADVPAAKRFFSKYELSRTEKAWSAFLTEHAGEVEQTVPVVSSEQVCTLTEISAPDAAFWEQCPCFYQEGDGQSLENSFAAFLTDKEFFLPSPEQVEELLLAHHGHLKVWQGKALYHRLLTLTEQVETVAFDGELAAYLLNPAATDYALAQTAAVYDCPAPAVTLTCSESSQALTDFLGRAATLPFLIQILEQRVLDTPHMTFLLHEIEMPLALVLAKMERTGFLLDTAGLRAYGGALGRELSEITQEIYDAAGMAFNLNSTKQLGHVLFEVLGLPPKKKTKTGYSTNAAVLEELASEHPVVEKLLRHRKLSKLTSTYVEGLLSAADQKGRVHSTFLQTEARTGRISSTEPNLQNIPVRTREGAKLRSFFQAKEGCVLIDADYSQIELRILAHMAEDRAMLTAFRDGVDIHQLTASQVFGVPVNEVTKEMRFRAKAVNFGIVYGIGAFSLARNIGVTVKDADDYIKGYLRTYPGVDAFMKRCISEGKTKGFVETFFGRRRYVPELTASNKVTQALGERIAMNSPIQGTAADVIKIAMIKVSNRLEREKLQTRLILQVHDELLLEAPESETDIACRILQEEMEHAVNLNVTLAAEVKTSHRWEKI